MLTWHWRTFNDLTVHELYELLALRQDVFNIEQKCTEPDIDNKDQQAMHLLGKQQNHIVAYLRVFPDGIIYADAASIGRVVTAHAMRGQGIGKESIAEAMRYLTENHPTTPINLSAQIYLRAFYESFGFIALGEPYDEAGIIHIKMRKP